MNILVTTLGYSWHIVPEILGYTNPGQFPLYSQVDSIAKSRQAGDIQPVDECWVVTIDKTPMLQAELQALMEWASHFHFILRVFPCKKVVELSNEIAIRRMRSWIYRIVLKSSELCLGGRLYLSLAGGRKTMSADMQDAANLFGCDKLLHVVDIAPLPEELKKKPKASMLEDYQRFGKLFLPLIINTQISRNVLLDSEPFPISAKRYSLSIPSPDEVIPAQEDFMLLEEIERRRLDSNRLYQNFMGSLLAETGMRRNAFRRMYILDKNTIARLKTKQIGKDEINDSDVIRKLPKCDLHSHLGGVLSAIEILKCVRVADNLVQKLKQDGELLRFHGQVQEAAKQHAYDKLLLLKSTINASIKRRSFERNIIFLDAIQKEPELFERLVYSPVVVDSQFQAIGIEKYQMLGDFQGSMLLQTEALIRSTCQLYAEKLKLDGVEYVELRCSPYKYCEYGLSITEVLNSIFNALDESSIEYRIIVIMGRTSTKEEISLRVEELLSLFRTNERFARKFVGVDLAGTEGAQSPAELRDCFLPLLRECVHITIHAGETESVENIWEAVYYLAADRIGHGLRLLDRPDLLNRFIDKHIGIEMCPSSNDQIVGYQTGYPLAEYMKQGLKVTVNTDNCGISKTSVSAEFCKAGALCGGISLWDCIVLVRNSLSIAFMDAGTKRRLMTTFENKILSLIEAGEIV